MTSYTITNKGTFMSQLLSTGCFDNFLLEKAMIRMQVTYEIDGHLNRDFYTNEEWQNAAEEGGLAAWSEIREHCRNVIKGRKAPTAFLFVMVLKPHLIAEILSDVTPDTASCVQGLSIAIRSVNDADGNMQIQVITGASMKSFTTDKSATQVWDSAVGRFLTAKGITFDKS